MITPDNLSIETLGLPKTEEMVRFFPEARDAAITMMDQSQLFYHMPEGFQLTAIGFFIIGYVSAEKKNWKAW